MQCIWKLEASDYILVIKMCLKIFSFRLQQYEFFSRSSDGRFSE